MKENHSNLTIDSKSSAKNLRKVDLPLDFSLILINTESSGNIGAVARVMKNFGFKDLILFNPKENHLSDTSKGFSMHAVNILEDTTVIRPNNSTNGSEIDELKKLFQKFDIVIGTSAKIISYKNIKRIPVFLDDLDLSFLKKNSRIALVFGRESTGLRNEEVILCDFLIKIPANFEYPTLNLSHAVGIILYSLYTLYTKIYDSKRAQVIPANKKDKDELLEIIGKTLKRVPLQTYRYERTFNAFKNLIGRAFISKKERIYLFNFFKKTNLVFEKPELIDSISHNDKKK